MNKNILILKPQKDYELIDSGEGEKLERFGSVTLRRPDPQALWLKSNPSLWDKADASFINSWKGEVPKGWEISLGGIKMYIRPNSFKHVGVFPEQANNWAWIPENLQGKKVLNLFGYTGGASVICSLRGAEVTHVDSSKTSVTLARENAELNEISNIRWIVEDAFEFVQKELRRGNTYDAIIMDPPSFGHGTKGEVWKLEKQFTDLVSDAKKLLSQEPTFFLMSGYAAGYSSVAYANNILELGNIEHGELAIEESVGRRLMPAGIFARWKR